MKPNIPLYEFFDRHFVPSRAPETCAETFRQYRNGLSLFARFLNCTPRLSDLADAKIAAFMVWLLDRGRAIGTVNKHRTMLVALAYVARRLELIDWWPEVAKIDTGPRRQSHSFAPHDVAKRERQIARPCLSAADRIAQAPVGTVAHYYRATFVLAELAQCSPRTRHQYATSVGKFIEFSRGHTPMDELTPEHIEAFYRYVRGTTGSILTAGKYRRQLRRVLYSYKPDTPRPVYPPNKIIDTEAPEGSLRWYFESRHLPERRICERYRGMSFGILRDFSRWLEREAMLSDLTPETINRYLQERLLTRKPRTVRGDRALLRMLWTSAFDWGLLDTPPRRLLRIRCDPLIPTAWTPEELRRLIAGCSHPDLDRMDRTGDVHFGRFLEALIRAAHDTALRSGDLLTATRDQLTGDGLLVLTQAKTGGVKACRLRPATMDALARVAVQDDPRLLPWRSGIGRLYKVYQRLLAVSGLPGGRRNGMQKLRRTSATMLEAECPGAATWHLGHKSPDLARRHYLDPRLAAPPRLPPAILDPPRLLEGPSEREIGGAA